MRAISAIACRFALVLVSPVQAKGCLKGAFVGGVAGHMAVTASSVLGGDASSGNAQVPSGQK
ncbi:hypothetical protein IVA81_11015 [Bradyrhizobium sp. 141]|nr:hypothetical protein [Bradyrhizobium sp. 141]